MRTFSFRQIVQCAVALVAPVAFFSVSMPVAHAGTIILEGSDAIGFHCEGGNAAACAYEEQTWKALDGASGLPIAVLGTPDGAALTSQGSGVTIDDEGEVAANAIGPLVTAGHINFAALYFLAGGGCCTEDDTLIPTSADAAVSAYLAAGGTVMIENYVGGMAWNFAIDPGAPSTNLNAFVAGVGGGQASGLSCDDGETVTATGLSNGFTQPTPMSCWTHQAYDQSVFTALGFNESFFTSPADGGYTGTGPYSSLLSDGNTITGGPSGAPEPASMLLIGTGLAGLGIVRIRRNKNNRAA